MNRKKGMAAELMELGVKLALDAAEKVLGDPRGQGAVTAASELAQKAMRKLEDLQSAASRTSGAPTRAELRELEKRVEEIQRKARDLGARLDAMAREDRHRAKPADAPPKARWRDPDDMEPR